VTSDYEAHLASCREVHTRSLLRSCSSPAITGVYYSKVTYISILSVI
jgi:hypothetical protein